MSNSSLPSWLKAEIFEPVLKDSFKNFKKIIKFNASRGTKPGDNYATLMLRIELEIELNDNTTKSISYMLKLAHNSEAYQETLGQNKNNIFDLEREMFTKYVQEFKKLYSDVGLDVEFGAKCYKLDVPYDHVLLEDLKAKGVRPTNRLSGLDEEHCLSLLKKLAQWHAASAVRVATIGPYPQRLLEGLFGEDSKLMMSKMTDGMAKYMQNTASTFEGHEEYFDDLKAMEGHIFENVMDVGVIDPNEFNALNHGDCWISNLMFQYDQTTNKLLDAYLVDYQMCKYGNVAMDLLYFLISSPKLELKINKFDYFVKHYYDQLIKHLKLLNYTEKLPTLIDIHTQLLKYGIWGYATAGGVMTGANLEPTETATFENIFDDTTEGDAFRTLLFSGKQYKEHLKIVLPFLHNRGALQLSKRSK
ncbi:uncharacterized protein LOC132786054 [Drosophila nasuta]|uniref:uncharacterized protein LOC132786054 n=1 Tax=Drosophila nasuta TaxID=42062 RepID=UPI00295E2F3A|nr:uncharacterized protein LOC132786054 [Drosophila nasuta]